MTEDGSARGFVGMPAALLLDHWGMMLGGIFDQHVFGWPAAYLVGSAAVSRNFRDVDIRVILDDDEFDQWFPTWTKGAGSVNARWSAICTAFSLWGERVTGLPIDFQIQRRSDVTAADWDKPRIPIGLFVSADAR